MKKLILAIAATVVAAIWAATMTSLSSVDLKTGLNDLPVPSQAVMLHAISTNASGTVTLKKVSQLSYSWNDVRTVTNVTYTTAWSNLTHTVTNDIVSAWRTNEVTVAGTTNTVVATNFLASAVNAMPSVYPWPDLLVTTNKVPVVEVYTNIPYQVVSSRRVQTLSTPRQASRYVTNELCNVTLSGGFKTNTVNCLFAPGDTIHASGTAFGGGRVQLIISR